MERTTYSIVSRALFAIKNVNVCFKEKCFPFKEVKTDKMIVL